MPTWQILVNVSTALVGLLGFLFGVWAFVWKRRESRQAALSTVVRELVAGMQKLSRANDARRTAEMLKHTFAQNQEHEHERARARIEDLTEEYGELIGQASEACKKMEVEFGAVQFRFPDGIRRLLFDAKVKLFEFGRHVNEGHFDAADIAAAKVSDSYKRLMKSARGWRLTDPFEAMRTKGSGNKLKKPEAEPQDRFPINEERMGVILSLIEKRLSDQAGVHFAVNPPQKLLDDPGLTERDSVIEELANAGFRVLFQDGTTELLSLQELIVLIHQLIVVDLQMGEVLEKLDKGGFGTTEVHLQTALRVEDLMRPEVVKALLKKVEFSLIPSDH